LQITFRIVDSSEAGRAFHWHRGFAAAGEAIYPRNEKTFEDLVFDRSVWCAVSSNDEYLALSYASFSDEDGVWEIGGLMVAAAMRGKGLGLIMMCLPLAGMLVNEQPLSWEVVPEIVAHVLASNDAPRRIIPKVGFVFDHPVEIPAAALPGLKADPDGFIRGDEFHLKIPDALIALADWCDAWDGKLLDGTDASIDLLPGVTLADWAMAFREMAA
jgi:hypothetical protein